MTPRNPFSVVVLLAALVLVNLLGAQEAPALKARMEARLPAIDALKARGVAGENNRGVLDVRGTATPVEQKIISDENGDRREAYGLVGAQTGWEIDAVGRRRAQQVAIHTKRGIWVQSAAGEWRKK